MQTTRAFGLAPLAILLGIGLAPGHRTRPSAPSHEAIGTGRHPSLSSAPRPTADPCASLNASTLGSYRSLIGRALASARADARANGTNGKYAVAATNTRDLLQRSYDRATQMVKFNQTQGNRNPNSTTYVEAGNFKAYLQSILNWLPDAAHWATISAAYHRSQQAMAAFDGTVDAIQRGGQLIGDAGRCFTAPYMSGSAQAG